MKFTIKQYLLFSSIFAIYTESFLINYIIDWKLLYLIIFTNYLILIRIKKLAFNPYFLALLLFFFFHGIITYTVIGIPYNYMLSQILGIAVVGTYYYNFIPLYSKEEILKIYLKMSLYVAILGYIMWFFLKNTHDYRLASVFREPAHYAIVVIPACYYFFKDKQYLKFSIIFGTLIMSSSSLGYIGCGLMFLLPNISLRRIAYLAALVPFVVLTFIFVYKEYPFFKMRVDDTYSSLNVINTGKFKETTNLSSYVMIGNIHIAKENVTDHPLGSGIGSHHYMHTERYIKGMRPPEYLRQQGRHVDNSFDANSLFTRLVSEFGIFGFLFVVFCVIKAAQCYKYDDLYFAQGIFIYFLLKLFRDGHYFPPELFFFIWIFYYSVRDKFVLSKPENTAADTKALG